ncbi:hypothetical protein GCM10010869_18070 [Mesorhizobium tianshanense]|nr:hypothetical protein GCM10010869_18070 [Mesorhizobium tianshanense]
MAEYGDCVGDWLEDRPGGLGQRGDVKFEVIVDNHIERGDDLAIAAARQNPGQGGEPFRPTDMAIAMHVDHGLLVRVDARSDEA